MQFFITGTDTDCGKTYVTSALIEAFKNQGKSAHAIKPIASGASRLNDGTLLSDDVLKLSHANQNTLSVNQWCYEPPVSPHLMKDPTLTAPAIVDFVKTPAFSECDVLLIEGAGGVMVPINQKETWLDVLKLLNIPVILVVGMRLGCLNHALLTASVLKSENITCLGWIANEIDHKMLYFRENVETLIERMPIPFITTVSHCGKITPNFFPFSGESHANL